MTTTRARDNRNARESGPYLGLGCQTRVGALLVLLDPGIAIRADDDHVRGRQGPMKNRRRGRRVAVLAPPLVATVTVPVADTVVASRDEAGQLPARHGRRRCGAGPQRGRQHGRRRQGGQLRQRRSSVRSETLGRDATAGAGRQGITGDSPLGVVRSPHGGDEMGRLDLAVGGGVEVPGSLASHGVEGNDAKTINKGSGPFFGQRAGSHPALGVVPVVLGRLDELLATAVLALLRLRGILGSAKVVEGLEPRSALGPGRPAGVLQRTAELALVEVLCASQREDADIVGWVEDNLVAELGRDGQAVEDQGLDIAEEVVALEAAEYAPQGTGVEAVVDTIKVSAMS
jgi:hypothetical protein